MDADGWTYRQTDTQTDRQTAVRGVTCPINAGSTKRRNWIGNEK